jgi:hypothetical protein
MRRMALEALSCTILRPWSRQSITAVVNDANFPKPVLVARVLKRVMSYRSIILVWREWRRMARKKLRPRRRMPIGTSDANSHLPYYYHLDPRSLLLV